MVRVLGAQGGNIQSFDPSFYRVGPLQMVAGPSMRFSWHRKRAYAAACPNSPKLHISLVGKIKHVWQGLDPKGGRNCPQVWDMINKRLDQADSPVAK
jgi:hypothetical protein